MWQVPAWCILSFCLLGLTACQQGSAQSETEYPTGSEFIHINQLGFYLQEPKLAIVQDSAAQIFHLQRVEDQKIVLTDSLSEGEAWKYSGQWVKKADFSDWQEEGAYQLVIPDLGTSFSFEIKSQIHLDLHKAAVKSYYFQRSSTEIPESFGGKWARETGHPDTDVEVHQSAASKRRPAGTRIASEKGWYDAGDYGKYVPNANFASGIFLSLYEHYPSFYDTLNLHLPESGNDVPDLLDEALWSIRWLLSMQEPEEGFVYHKLTTVNHAAKCMPEADKGQRYVIGKSTGATLGFAAVMAQASRIFRDKFPTLSDSCLKAAQLAWDWGVSHPDVSFQNPPDIHTGLYKDDGFTDEMAWAASELFITSGEGHYLEKAIPLLGAVYNPPGWRDVIPLAWMSLLHHKDKLNKGDRDFLERQLTDLADRFASHCQLSSYGIPLGRSKWDFIWGSNGIHASMGMVMMAAHTLKPERNYRDASLAVLDYLMGRNATAYSFVTGFGKKSPQNPHHRPSEADGVSAPVPGLLVGGPQGEAKNDGCVYASNMPANAYLDSWCSYTTNEVCINWNAVLVYLTGAIEATQ